MSKPTKLRVLLIGSGGRESALAWKLSRSPRVEKVFVVPGNGGTAQMLGVSNVNSVREDDFEGLVKLARELGVGLCVPGPDTVVVGGIEEVFRAANIPCFAPSKEAAQLEGSKAYAKDFMKRYDIPTAEYRNFTSYKEAKQYLESTKSRVVLKASDLAAGKVVVLPKTLEEGLEALKSIMLEGEFGSAGEQVVIEEFLEGDQISILTFSDGITFKSLPPAQDHKKIFHGDRGPNMGGMGCYAPVRLDRTILHGIEETILRPTFEGLKKEESIDGLLLGTPFVGMLFTGVMITKDGPKVLEYKARFGDPETQTLLPLISEKTDFAEILMACVEGRLSDKDILTVDKSCAVVICSAEGYPGEHSVGDEVTIEDRHNTRNLTSFWTKTLYLEGEVNFFHAGTRMLGSGRVVTSGGLVMAVSATADTLKRAIKLAYAGVSRVKFHGKFYGRDIAYKALPHRLEAPTLKKLKLNDTPVQEKE